MNGTVAALISEAQGLVPSGWRPAGHPQVIMVSDPRPHLLTTRGLCRFPLRLPRGVLGQPRPPLEEDRIPGPLLSHQPRAPASICPLFALPGPNLGKQRLRSLPAVDHPHQPRPRVPWAVSTFPAVT